MYTICRFDGVGFSRLTKECFSKPFDLTFAAIMEKCATFALEKFHAKLAYTGSDEITMVWAQPSVPYLFEQKDRVLVVRNGGVEKLVSIVASYLSVTFTSASGVDALFDGRVVASEVTYDEVCAEINKRRRSVKTNSVSDALLVGLKDKLPNNQNPAKFLKGIPLTERFALLEQYELPFSDRQAFGAICTSFGKYVATLENMRTAFSTLEAVKC